MKKRKQWKIVIVAGIMAIFGVALYAAAGQIENKSFSAGNPANRPAEEMEREPFLKEDDEEIRGTVKLEGKKYSYSHEIQTYLFIGTDASGSQEPSGDDYRGNMADFLMLAVVDKTSHTYAALELNRDTMTEVTLMQQDGSGMANATIQLCTAHWYGGTNQQSCENTVQAVSKLLGGVRIDGYYALNMDQIPALNHAVGGVPVTIESDFSAVDKTLKQGETLILSDAQAYTFVHDRYGVDDEENSSRMRRQRQYLKSFFTRVQEKTSENSDFILEMYRELKENAVTDITGKTISRLTKEISSGENRGIYTLEGKSKKGQALGDGILHTEFYVDKKSLKDVMKELYGLKE